MQARIFMNFLLIMKNLGGFYALFCSYTTHNVQVDMNGWDVPDSHSSKRAAGIQGTAVDCGRALHILNIYPVHYKMESTGATKSSLMLTKPLPSPMAITNVPYADIFTVSDQKERYVVVSLIQVRCPRNCILPPTLMSKQQLTFNL